MLLLLPVHFLVKPTKRRPRFARFLFHHFRAKQVLEQSLVLCDAAFRKHNVRWKGCFVIERKHLQTSRLGTRSILLNGAPDVFVVLEHEHRRILHAHL